MNRNTRMIKDGPALLAGLFLLLAAEGLHAYNAGLVAVSLGMSLVGIVLVARGFTHDRKGRS